MSYLPCSGRLDHFKPSHYFHFTAAVNIMAPVEKIQAVENVGFLRSWPHLYSSLAHSGLCPFRFTDTL